jgi:hypothetical protein
MKLDMLAAIIALIVCSVPGGRAQTAQAPSCENGRLIVSVRATAFFHRSGNAVEV